MASGSVSFLFDSIHKFNPLYQQSQFFMMVQSNPPFLCGFTKLKSHRQYRPDQNFSYVAISIFSRPGIQARDFSAAALDGAIQIL
jgi:hypothetical protein